MITISFYSYKGGVGRSLALANLGVYLAQFGATVVMTDFDLEAPGLHYKLRPGDPLEVPGRGLAGLLADVSRGIDLDDIDFDIAIDVSEHATTPEFEQDELGQQSGKLLLVPAGNPMGQDYWQDLAVIDWDILFTTPPRPGVAALSRVKQELIERYEPDVLLVDSRTGITPGGGVATTLLPDVVVTLLLNTAEHVDGSRMVVSAVTNSGADGLSAPRVVPVLSRYSSPPPRRAATPAARRRLMATQGYESDSEVAPVEDMRTRLVANLDSEAASRVATPLVLHSDPLLQYNERLAFGPYAGSDASGLGPALLEDYLRLFAELVPRNTFLRYLAGVRARVRGILLDRPDDAMRTLESLATLVGDEAAFIDLVKLYVLRRDSRNLLRAAERLFRVHRRIVVHESISQELRTVAVNERPAPANDVLQNGPFLEAYWRQAAPQDIQWGASVARRAADVGNAPRARELADELLAADPSATALATVVGVIAAGSPLAEQLAVQIALRNFEAGADSSDFLEAAAQACSYQPNKDLALRLLETPVRNALADDIVIELLNAAGLDDEAGARLVDAVVELDGYEPTPGWMTGLWRRMERRNPGLRREVLQRNPQALSYLETEDGEG